MIATYGLSPDALSLLEEQPVKTRAIADAMIPTL
jgi:hypothetical protein